MNTPTFYELLGVANNAPPDIIQAAWRAQVRKWHPDIAGEEGEERTRAINEAYATLSDPDRRDEYDKALRGEPSSAEVIVEDDWGEAAPLTEDDIEEVLDDATIDDSPSGTPPPARGLDASLVFFPTLEGPQPLIPKLSERLRTYPSDQRRRAARALNVTALPLLWAVTLRDPQAILASLAILLAGVITAFVLLTRPAKPMRWLKMRHSIQRARANLRPDIQQWVFLGVGALVALASVSGAAYVINMDVVRDAATITLAAETLWFSWYWLRTVRGPIAHKTHAHLPKWRLAALLITTTILAIPVAAYYFPKTFNFPNAALLRAEDLHAVITAGLLWAAVALPTLLARKPGAPERYPVTLRATHLLPENVLEHQSFGNPGEPLDPGRHGPGATVGGPGENLTLDLLNTYVLPNYPGARVVHGVRTRYGLVHHAITLGTSLLLITSPYWRDGRYWWDGTDLFFDGQKLNPPLDLLDPMLAYAKKWPHLRVACTMVVHTPSPEHSSVRFEPGTRIDAIPMLNAAEFTRFADNFLSGETRPELVNVPVFTDMLAYRR